jgi:hypothetical protein
MLLSEGLFCGLLVPLLAVAILLYRQHRDEDTRGAT